MRSESPVSSGSPPARSRFPAFAWGVLAYSLLVVVWGYFLRISNSGDGCGTDWPLCNGAVVPASAEFPTWVELTHRASSGGVLVLTVAMAVWAFSIYPRHHAVRWAALASVLFTVTESLFGAVLVVFGWVAGDMSVGRVLIRPVHVVNTFTLMAALGLTAWWASRGVERLPPLAQPAAGTVVPAVVAVLALASVGSWTGLAGTAFPVETVREGLGQYLSPDHLLVYLRTVHPIVALVAVVLLARVILDAIRGHGRVDGPDAASGSASPNPDRTTRGLAVGVAGLAALQLVVGPLTIALLHPTTLRLVHLLLADLLWLGLVFLASAALEGSTSPSSGRRRPRAGAPPALQS
ncbi:MAG: COX15/CtaA family protein [Gemmatimonadota bacterium]